MDSNRWFEHHFGAADGRIVLTDPLSRQHYLDWLAGLFEDPEPLCSIEKGCLEQGLWSILGLKGDTAVGELVWDSQIPFETRKRAIASMCSLFRNLFSTVEVETSCNMWWDVIITYPYKPNFVQSDAERIKDLLFETLVEILGMDSEDCQGAALHGFGHLHHPQKKEVIERYIAKHPELSEDDMDYCRQAIEGDVM